MDANPTHQAYSELRLAFDHYNTQLFEGRLPPCLITLQRKKRSYGYFSPKRFVDRTGKTTDEIAINPTYILVQSPEEVLSTVVHELCHHWQAHFGEPGRRGYHNKQWADKMIEVGLMPSTTGKPGGSITGEKMSHYIIPDDRFARATKALLSKDFRVSWADRFQSREKVMEAIAKGKMRPTDPPAAALGAMVTETGVVKFAYEPKPTRVKFTCPKCQCNAWGKPSLHLICGECGKRLLGDFGEPEQE